MVGICRGSQRARQLVVGLLCLSLCLGGVGGAVAPEGIAPEILDSERTLLSIDVAETGDATWEVRYQINTSTPEKQAGFEELATDVENEPEQFIEVFRERASEMVDDAREETGREMGIAEVDVEVEEGLQEFGVIKYEFEWARFANTSETQLEIGDAISGLVVGEDNQLTLHWPESYELDSVTPAVADTDAETDENRVVWEGETVFGPNEPRVVVTESTGSALPTGILVGVVLLVAIVAVGGLVGWRRVSLPSEQSDEITTRSSTETESSVPEASEPTETESSVPETSEPTETESSVPETSEPTETESSVPETSEPTDTEPRPTHADGTRTADTPIAAETNESTTTPEATSESTEQQELLSSEERVLTVIEESNGRVKQQTVTERLGWSAARTSQVVTNLRDDGRIESFRVGRENVLQLPDTEQ